MEELIAALLGYYGAHITPLGIDGPLKSKLHPAELALVTAALPLGGYFDRLRSFVDDWRTGTTAGNELPNDSMLLAPAVDAILTDYEAAVLSLSTPTSLSLLVQRYRLTLETLMGFLFTPSSAPSAGKSAASSSSMNVEAGDRNQRLTRFLLSDTVPQDLRVLVGKEAGMSHLLLVAHWVAHGTVPSVESFIGWDEDKQMALVSAKCIPLGMPVKLAALIVRAGMQRQAVRKDPNTYATAVGGMDGGVTEFARDEDAYAAAEVFKSLYDESMIVDGLMAWDEVENRVLAAERRWSDRLWRGVREACKLTVHMGVLRDCFLCHRGDLWFSFISAAFLPICRFGAGGAVARGSVGPFGTKLHKYSVFTAVFGGNGSDNPEVVIGDAFRGAMQHVGLSESAVCSTCLMTLAGGSFDAAGVVSKSHEETGRILVQRFRRLSLQCVFAPGVNLVIDESDVRHYMALLALQLTVKFSLYALMQVRNGLARCERIIQVEWKKQASSLSSSVLGGSTSGASSASFSSSRFAAAALAGHVPSGPAENHLQQKQRLGELSSFAAMVYQLNFVLTAYSQMLHLDVIDTASTAFEEEIQKARSVEAAKKAHTKFLMAIVEGSYLRETEGLVVRAIESACILGCAMLSLLERPDWTAVNGIGPTELSSLASIRKLMAEHVIEPLHAATAAHGNHTPFATRLDLTGKGFGSSSVMAAPRGAPMRQPPAVPTAASASSSAPPPQLSAATRAKISRKPADGVE